MISSHCHSLQASTTYLHQVHEKSSKSSHLPIMEPTSVSVSPNRPACIRGSCSCGSCVYIGTMLPLSITFCHCIDCRKNSGAPFLSYGLFHNSALRWTGSHPGKAAPIKISPSHVKTSNEPIAVRGSCAECGSQLFMKYHCRPDGTSVVMGIVDEDSVSGILPAPKEHIFLSEKAQWFELAHDDGLQRHQSFNESFQNRFETWIRLGCPKRPDLATAGDAPVKARL